MSYGAPDNIHIPQSAQQSPQERLDDIKRRALNTAEGLVHSSINARPTAQIDIETLAHQVASAARIVEDYLTDANSPNKAAQPAHSLSRANSAFRPGY